MLEKQFVTLPVKKVFTNLAIPTILSMVFSSLYIIADGIFVGRYIGDNALAAVNLIMPILMIVFALSNMLAVGSSVKVSTTLGAGNIEKAKKLFSASVIIIVGVGFGFSILGFIFAKPLIFAIIKDTALAQMAYDYVKFFIIGLPFIMPLFAMDNFLRVCGKSKYSMWINIMVSVMNVGLDWLFIARLGLGIEFSSLASVISMFLGACFSFAPFFTKKITLHFAKPKMSKRQFLGIVYNGASEFFSSVAGAISAVMINVFLLNLGGAIAVASYGIVMYIDTLLIGILYGALDSVQPAVSYNIGAKKLERTFSFFKISCVVTAGFSALCMVGILVFPKALASVFVKGDDFEIINMTIAALTLFAPSYLFTWFNMVTSAFLTAMNKPKESMLIMLFRAVVFPLLSLLVLSYFWGVYGVFFTAAVSAALTFVVAIGIWSNASKKLKKNIKFLESQHANGADTPQTL